MLALLRNALFGVFTSLMLVSAVYADDWLASKLRGPVVQMIDGKWQPLERGMVVPDDRAVRTLAAGYVTFTRGAETLDLRPNTQIQIFDKAGKKPFTTVKQYFGTLSVEAEVRNVQHFAVDTPFLAAVVKGTRFTVQSNKKKSTVAVQRGHVAVEQFTNGSHVTLSVGQSATVDGIATNSIIVEGSGKLPVVLGSSNQPLVSVNNSSGGASIQVDAGHLVNVTAGSSGVAVNVAGVRVGLGGDGAGTDSDGSGSGHTVNHHVSGLHLGLL